MKRPAIVVISKNGSEIASTIAAKMDVEIFGLEGRVENADVPFSETKKVLQDLFSAGRAIIAVMAAGAVIRILAPILKDKHVEPAVIAISDDGSSVVPLLGGHHGANSMAKEIATIVKGNAAITTAGDIHFGIALDEPPEGWSLVSPENTKLVMAKLLDGVSVCLEGNASDEAKWLEDSDLEIGLDGDIMLLASTRKPIENTDDDYLMYVPKVHVLGIGCERHCSTEELIKHVEGVLDEEDISKASIACVCSIDLKADEKAISEVAKHLGVECRFFEAERLEIEKERLQNPSKIVFQEVGCHGVAEGAALAAVGSNGHLVVPKSKSKRSTVAIGRAPKVLTEKEVDQIGRSQGKLFVIGIGPGQEAWRSPEASRMVEASTDLVGYSLYLDLICDLSSGKIRHDFDLGKEEARVRHAMMLAGEGKSVSLVCSGDAGIYAMATLVFELLKNGELPDAAKRIGIEVSPGISALQAAAARAGAPLGHDFCTISLSDLLTPWEAIKMRVKAAAEGDFVIAFYNPVSRRRRTQLAYAKDVLLKHRPKNTPVILATNLGREEEKVRVVELFELEIDDVDMLTVVIVGSSETQTVETGSGQLWTFTPRGYSAKADSKIGSTKFSNNDRAEQ